MAGRDPAPSILITIEPPGAVWPHVDALVRELSALGAEVTIAALTPLRPGQRLEYAGVPGVDLLACPHPVATPAEHLAARGRVADWLLSVEEMFNPDVVHLTGYLHAGLPWCGKLLVAGYPGTGASYGRLDLSQRWVCNSAFLHGLKGADLVVTPSATMMSALTRHFGVVPGRVIRDGRDPGRYAPALKEPVILSVGGQRDSAAKPSVLEQVAPRLPWPVVVGGEQLDGEGKPVRLEGVSAMGRLHPSQLVPWFNRSSVYVALSAEGPGTWLPEAGLSGCALVLGDTAALREAWSGAAMFVPVDDRDALSSGLRTLLADRRLREAMGNAARRRALGHTARTMAEAYMAAYRDLIAKRAPNQFAEERLA
ncbi:glycosyltransferase family 4 protein [Magnetospirillum sp. UT-4]|uniref:glycosyltransferase family 4 protein n=1 Tax=Magnetospirillum sp. UT-4 TaxID=2681467 RepID=UPI00137F7A53|nr:glycosyltransferase family 4 protein [Magnetospirillum sp. UT-4]CAA7622613.1 putative Glycosyl transferase group 1 [Magnetospirillum sp. UT-4]